MSVPKTIGRYSLLAELGRGAMGVVYKAEDPLLNRTVAIKTILMSDDPAVRGEYETRFLQEAKAAGGLNHPAIITIYDVGREGDQAYMAMELLDGIEVRDMLAAGRIAAELALDIAAQVAEGLAFAHERGVVHRDVKPANIMVVRGRQAKIMDFGIARLQISQVKTQTGMVLGSPQYMSPEQIAGRDVDGRSDIFSLGVVLYQMVTGEPPFAGENVSQLMFKVCHAEHRAPSTLDPALPSMLDLILNKALAKDPAQRYQKADEMAADLAACRAQLARPPAASADPYAKTLPLGVDVVLAATVPQAKIAIPEKMTAAAKTVVPEKTATPAKTAASEKTAAPAKTVVLEKTAAPAKAVAPAATARQVAVAQEAIPGLKVSRKFDAAEALHRLATGAPAAPRRRRNAEMLLLAAALAAACVGAAVIVLA